jgi:hypothetical protein
MLASIRSSQKLPPSGTNSALSVRLRLRTKRNTSSAATTDSKLEPVTAYWSRYAAQRYCGRSSSEDAGRAGCMSVHQYYFCCSLNTLFSTFLCSGNITLSFWMVTYTLGTRVLVPTTLKIKLTMLGWQEAVLMLQTALLSFFAQHSLVD